MLEPKAPPTRNGPNTGSLAPGVRRRVNKKKDSSKKYQKNYHITINLKIKAQNKSQKVVFHYCCFVLSDVCWPVLCLYQILGSSVKGKKSGQKKLTNKKVTFKKLL